MKEKVKEVWKMLDGISHLVEKECSMVGRCYYNDYGVNVFLLSDGKILLEPSKFYRKIPKKSKIVEYNYFQNRFRDDEKSDLSLNIDALKFCDIYEDEEENYI